MTLVTDVAWTCNRSPDLGQRQGAVPGEGEQHERLVAAERDAVRLEQRVELADQHLLGSHDRGNRPHGCVDLGGLTRRMLLPQHPGALDGVERQQRHRCRVTSAPTRPRNLPGMTVLPVAVLRSAPQSAPHSLTLAAVLPTMLAEDGSS